MTPANLTTNPTRPPRLEDLTARYLAHRATTQGDAFAEDRADVEPHEVLGGFRADPRTGWAEVVGFAKLFGLNAEKAAAPPDWANYAGLSNQSPAVPLAAGTFPQQVRDLLPLLGGEDRSALLPIPSAPVSGFTAMRGWISRAIRGEDRATLLTATGLAMGLGDGEMAEAALTASEHLCTGDWRAAWENQRAAVLWQSGRHQDALAAWLALADLPAAHFNAGMALMFLGRPAEAIPHLKAAIDGLPTTSGWSHLANVLLLAAQVEN